MKLIRLSSWGIGLALVAFFAMTSHPHFAKNLEKELQGRPAPSKGDAEPVGSEEWVKIGKWMEAHSCALRYQFIDGLPEGHTKETAKQLIAARYRQINRLNGEAQAALIKQVQAQDQIFGIQIKYRRTPKSPEAVSAMRDAVANLIDAQVAERGVRLKHLQIEINQLQQDRKQPEVIDKLARNFLNRATNPRALHSPGELGSDRTSEPSDAETPQ
jgi:hypothetical protein